jgi:peptidoglycan/LPS O-acetylase OafA/YrhL
MLIALAAFRFAKDMPFPGWCALLPTAGAFLTIAGGSESWINRTLLASRAMGFVGLIPLPADANRADSSV